MSDSKRLLARASSYLADANRKLVEYTLNSEVSTLESARLHIKTALSAVEKEIDKLK